MATAIIKGLISKRIVEPKNIIASDTNSGRFAELGQLGITTTLNNSEVVAKSKVIIIAVKPDVVVPILKEAGPQLDVNHVLISIAAGIKIATIEDAVPSHVTRIVRVMPNTSCLVGASASAITLSERSCAREEDRKIVETIFSACGKTAILEEKNLDAVTGLSGSGPAYVFQFIEALADGGVRAGLARDVALMLATQTVYGAAKMVLENPGMHPAQLKDMVASPGGTTITGLHELERGGMRGIVMNAVLAAAKRGEELGNVKPKL